MHNVKVYAKALTALAAFVGELVTLGAFHGTALLIATAALGALGVVGVYAVPNATPKA